MQKALEIAVILSAVDRMTAVINRATNNAAAKFTGLQTKADAVSKKAFGLGRDLGAMGLAAGLALSYPIKQAADFETGLANIRKVTNGLNDAKDLQKMGADVINLSRELPIAQSELLDLVAAGGRMGVPKEELLDYTKLVAKMASAFDAPAAQIGEDMGQLATVFNIPIQKIGQLADAVNFLDDNSIAKGPDIIDVMRRVGGMAQQTGLAAPNVAALASTFLTMGKTAEVAGTATNALLGDLASATKMPERFQKGISALGLSAKAIQHGMAIDPQNTILGVLEKINSLPKEDQIGVTRQIFGKEHGPAIALLATGIKTYREQLELLNNPRLNGSVQREFTIRQQTANAQMQLAKNQVQALAVVAGTALLPALNQLIGRVTPWIQRLASWAEKNQDLVAKIGLAVAAFAAFSLAGSGISFLVGGVAKGVSLLSGAFGFLSKALGFVGRAVMLVSRVFLANPILLIITLIAVAVYLIYKNWGTIVEFFRNLWDKVKVWFSAAWEWIKKFFLNYSLPGLIIKHWGDITSVLSKFYDAGKNIMLSLWNGIKSLAMKPVEAMLDVTKKLRDYLPFSPAKVGPLRDLHRVRIIETIAGTMKPGPMVDAMDQVATATVNARGRRSTGGGSSAGGGGMVINFSPTITIGPGGSAGQNDIMSALRQYETELVRLVESAMDRRRRGKY